MKKINVIIIFFLIFLFFGIVSYRLYYLNILKGNYYKEELKNKTEIYISGLGAPRGRILDRNGKVLVDNIGVKTIIYNKLDGITKKEEVDIAYKLSSIFELSYNESIKELKSFFMLLYPEIVDKLVTEEEYKLVEERKLLKSDLTKLKYERITDEMLSAFDQKDKLAAHIYALMNKGYKYEPKVILKDASDSVYAQVLESNIMGITGELTWERTYLYNDTFKSILGSVGSIPSDEVNTYLDSGYDLSDTVGVSYLEKQYEEYLKGEKAVYKVNNDNTLTVIKEATRGSDLTLSIDIDLQMFVEETLKEKILLSKKDANTEYFKDSYCLVSDPNTGAILAMSGIRLIGDTNNPLWQDITPNIITNSFTPGSIVKAASITVGYQNHIIEAGTKVLDSCVKLYLVPAKCSYKSLGVIDDIGALKNSSNYYQFLIAIGLTNQKYKKDMKLNATIDHFKVYRDTFASYGLGVLTGIDLPNEQIGITGTKVADDLLLNIAIGQYDTYTPIQILSYINTVATNGEKRIPKLMQSINTVNETITNDNYIVDKVDLDTNYFNRIKTGLNQVLTLGTGRGYINPLYNPAGKTGTSESFYDSNSDGIVDTETISSFFVGFAPYDNPKYSIVVITPNVSHNNGRISYKSKVNRYISKQVTDFLFENY